MRSLLLFTLLQGKDTWGRHFLIILFITLNIRPSSCFEVEPSTPGPSRTGTNKFKQIDKYYKQASILHIHCACNAYLYKNQVLNLSTTFFARQTLEFAFILEN